MNNLYIKFSLFLFSLCMLSASLLGQTHILMGTTSPRDVSVGTYSFYDSGDGGNYGESENSTMVFNSAPGTVIRVTFSSFDVKNEYWSGRRNNRYNAPDYLRAYDGNSISTTTLLGEYTGTTSPGVLTSSDNSITFTFETNNNRKKAGWKASIEVLNPNEVYCIPEISNLNFQYISNVLIGNIDNDSGSGEYEDYTDLFSTDVTIAENHILTVTNGYPYNGVACMVWIDWNKDGDFDDPNETIPTSGGMEIYTAMVTPPADADGNTTMRVRINYQIVAGSCENTRWGEVEDYTLNVVSNIPKISGFEPEKACVNTSANITIFGENLGDATEVKIGNVTGTIISNTATEITVNILSVTTACNGAISVTKAGVSGLSVDNFTVNSLCAEGMEEIKLPDVTGKCSATADAPTITDACVGEITGTTSDQKKYTTQGTHVITWAFDYGMGIGTEARPFKSLSAARSVSASGRYYFDLGNGKFQADVDNSEGGGWVLILQYHHKGGTNPSLNIIGKGTDLPVNTNSSLGTDLSTATSWGHAGNACLSDMTGAEEIRWFAKTSGHSRVIHFRSLVDLTYAQTGKGSFDGIESAYTLLTGHSANLPAAARNEYDNKGNEALTNFPIYLGGTYHWGIRGLGNRWEVDDYPNNYSKSTIHKMWIRGALPTQGYIITAEQKVIVKDNTQPVPDVANLPDVGGEFYATANYPKATDNCAGTVTGTTTDLLTYTATGEYTVTWTYDDGNGNTNSQEQKVIVTGSPKITAERINLPDICEGTVETPIVTFIEINSSTVLTEMSVQITGDYAEDEDELILSSDYEGDIVKNWDPIAGKLTLKGTGSIEDFENAIMNVRFVTSTSGTRVFSITFKNANYLPGTGHFYEFVPYVGVTWTQARDKAAAKTYYGLKGYLATLTSEEEAVFAGSKIVGSGSVGAGWIGASDVDKADEWRWVTGPEGKEDDGKGRHFWQGKSSKNGGSEVPNADSGELEYSKWNTNEKKSEPNDSNGEYYAHITDPDPKFKNVVWGWNDLDNNGGAGQYRPKGYVVEYGGLSTDEHDIMLKISASTTITVNPKPKPIGIFFE